MGPVDGHLGPVDGDFGPEDGHLVVCEWLLGVSKWSIEALDGRFGPRDGHLNSLLESLHGHLVPLNGNLGYPG